MAEDKIRAVKVPRLSHKKSKMGCMRCKARKVKCDEVHPTCGPCDRHGVSCEYMYQAPNTPHPPESAAVATLSGPAAQDSLLRLTPVATPPYSGVDPDVLAAESPARRLLELKLLHHYVAAVCFTFPAVDEAAVLETWRIHVPRMAFAHAFLLNAVFAVSALHLARTSPGSTTRTEHAHTHRVYLNAAVQEQRQAVAQLGPANADAVSLCAAMIMWQSFALYIQEEDDPPGTNTYAPPLKWLRLSAAIAAVIRATNPWITERSHTNIIIHAKPNLFDWRALFDVKNSVHFTDLLTWRPPSSPATPANSTDATAYQHTVSYIGTIFAALSENESLTCLARRFIALGSLMPERFQDLLGEMDPRALVIMAHFFAMTKKVEGLWWFEGVAEREVPGIASVLPEEWQGLIAWPVAMLGGNWGGERTDLFP